MFGVARWPRYLTSVAVLLMFATSCSASVELTMVEPAIDDAQLSNRAASSTPEPEADDNPFSDPVLGGGVDFRLTRSDIECERADLNTYPDTPFVIAHVVVDGNLGEPCFGDPDDRLVRAWQVLAAITPAGQLHDLGVFGGYVSNEQGQTTLAFVNRLAEDDSLYQMAINLEEAELDPAELMMTMAHEFAHVFVSQPSQLNRSAYPKDCGTWHNLRGCYTENSLMWEWVQLFWAGGLIDEVNQKQEPTNEVGEDRCLRSASFLGPYAASHPEEDFAEAFSAFVFRLQVDSPGLQAKMEWFAQQPGLNAFRNQAVEAGFGPLPNFFERCG